MIKVIVLLGRQFSWAAPAQLEPELKGKVICLFNVQIKQINIWIQSRCTFEYLFNRIAGKLLGWKNSHIDCLLCKCEMKPDLNPFKFRMSGNHDGKLSNASIWLKSLFIQL